jgi:hypothetical protein
MSTYKNIARKMSLKREPGRKVNVALKLIRDMCEVTAWIDGSQEMSTGGIL